MSRSSIFSFETLRTDGLLPRTKLIALTIVLLMLVTAEGLARIALRPTGDYWEYWNKESADKFLWYRHKNSASTAADIVIIGDSTAARDFIPSEFSQACNGKTAFNLGWPANFPLAMEQTTLPLLDLPYRAPDTVICSISPKAFTGHPLNRAFETPILASAFARHQRGETLVSDYVYLTRLYSAREFASGWFSGEGLFEPPKDGGAMPLKGQEESGHRPATKGDLFDKTGFERKRLEVIDRLAEIARYRNFQLVFVIPPRTFEHRSELEEKFIGILSEKAADYGFQVWDVRRLPPLEAKHFFDPGHLNRTGAELYSQTLAGRLCREGNGKQ